MPFPSEECRGKSRNYRAKQSDGYIDGVYLIAALTRLYVSRRYLEINPRGVSSRSFLCGGSISKMNEAVMIYGCLLFKKSVQRCYRERTCQGRSPLLRFADSISRHRPFTQLNLAESVHFVLTIRSQWSFCFKNEGAGILKVIVFFRIARRDLEQVGNLR